MLKRIHKVIGVSIALIIIHLSITGIILVQPAFFNLYDKFYKSDWLLAAFDMYTHADVKAISFEENMMFISSNLFIDDEVVNLGEEKIIGAYSLKGDLLFATPSSLSIVKEVNFDYKVIKLKTFQTPLSYLGVGNKGKLIAIDEEKNKFLILKINNEYELSLTDISYEKIVFKNVNYEEADFYLNLIQGPGLQALRLITDLHNGRFFGFFVMIVFIIASICNIFLALSGSYMTIRPLILRKYIKHKDLSLKNKR